MSERITGNEEALVKANNAVNSVVDLFENTLETGRVNKLDMADMLSGISNGNLRLKVSFEFDKQGLLQVLFSTVDQEGKELTFSDIVPTRKLAS